MGVAASGTNAVLESAMGEGWANFFTGTEAFLLVHDWKELWEAKMWREEQLREFDAQCGPMW